MDPSVARTGHNAESEVPTDRATVSFASEVFEFSAGVPGRHSQLLVLLLMIVAIAAGPPLVVWVSGATLGNATVCIIVALQLTALLALHLTRHHKT